MFSSNFLIALMILLWLAPIVDIYNSKKVSNEERYLWIIACVFLSWFCWVAFIFFAPLNKSRY